MERQARAGTCVLQGPLSAVLDPHAASQVTVGTSRSISKMNRGPLSGMGYLPRGFRNEGVTHHTMLRRGAVTTKSSLSG
jgi:hypothetical protein